jgi:hypothetical protein
MTASSDKSKGSAVATSDSRPDKGQPPEVSTPRRDVLYMGGLLVGMVLMYLVYATAILFHPLVAFPVFITGMGLVMYFGHKTTAPNARN